MPTHEDAITDDELAPGRGSVLVAIIAILGVLGLAGASHAFAEPLNLLNAFAQSVDPTSLMAHGAITLGIVLTTVAFVLVGILWACAITMVSRTGLVRAAAWWTLVATCACLIGWAVIVSTIQF